MDRRRTRRAGRDYTDLNALGGPTPNALARRLRASLGPQAFRDGGMTSNDAHFVYIVRCGDGSLYTGYARDPRARIRAHNAGRGARYTSGRRPVRLVYSQAFETLSAALKREYELKQWSRSKKQALVRATRRMAAARNREL